MFVCESFSGSLPTLERHVFMIFFMRDVVWEVIFLNECEINVRKYVKLLIINAYLSHSDKKIAVMLPLLSIVQRNRTL